MKKISVVIPCYNSGATITRCIESVLATGYHPLEIIVVDDNSSDNTTSMVEKLSLYHPDVIILLRNTQNRGPAHARNIGASRADGSYLFFLDSDTELQQDALSIFAKRIESEQVDAVCGIYHAEPLNSSPAAVYKALLNNYFFSNRGVFEYEVFNGAVGGIRREVFNEVGGYNENLQWGMDYENEELGHRLRQYYKVLIDPAIQARHEFPGMTRLTSTYFTRVSLWMELFMKRRQFEAGGTAVAQSGVGAASVPLFLCFSFLSLSYSWAAAGAIFFLFLYLYGYSGFLFFALKKKPFFTPVVLLLNLYFNVVLTAGAFYGVLRFLLGLKRVT